MASLADPFPVAAADSPEFLEIFSIVWRRKWFILASVLAFAVVAGIYSLVVQKSYTAEVLLAPVSDKSTEGLSGQLGALGGLAGLAGISIGAGGANTVEPIAVLQSRDFARTFIEDQHLLTVLLADKWNPATKSWKGSDPRKWPDIRDGIKYFQKQVLKVTQDKKTNLVTLAVEWKDPNVAAEWANMLVERVNELMRQRALAQAQTHVSYLQETLSQASIVTLQQSIGRLLESELQKLMIARGNREYSFRILDHAEVPKYPSWPKRPIIVAAGGLLGGMLALFVVLLRDALARKRVASARFEAHRTPAAIR
jgi:uncharacterized protein involved in exopolysaccharide biosynthesis